MKLSPDLQKRIFRDALISVFIYALPVLLMLLSFKISGQRPWKEKPHSSINKTK